MLVVQVVDKEWIQVIHYTNISKEATSASKPLCEVGAAISGVSWKSSAIIEELIMADVNQSNIELLKYFPGVSLYSNGEAVERARSRLHERSFNLYNNNCECLINWAYTNKPA